jgi:hypothetical protein
VKANIMSFRFERQTLGRPAHAEPLEQADHQHFAAASSRAKKKTGGKGGKGANPETPAKSMGCGRAYRWRKLAETGGNPQDDRYGEPTVPTLDLTQS